MPARTRISASPNRARILATGAGDFRLQLAHFAIQMKLGRTWRSDHVFGMRSKLRVPMHRNIARTSAPATPSHQRINFLMPSITYLPLPSPALEATKGEAEACCPFRSIPNLGDATVLAPINAARHARPLGCAWLRASSRLLRRGLTGAAGHGLPAVSGRGASRLRNSAPAGGPNKAL
jgi:hypothetical protein